MDVNSARYLVSALIQATAIAWSLVLVIHVFYHQSFMSRLTYMRNDLDILKIDEGERPTRFTQFMDTKSELKRMIGLKDSSMQKKEDLELILKGLNVRQEHLDKQLERRRTGIEGTISSLEMSLKTMTKHFRLLRIVTVLAFFTVGSGIVSMSLLEDSFIYGPNLEAALVTLTAVLSIFAFLLLTGLTSKLLETGDSDVLKDLRQ